MVPTSIVPNMDRSTWQKVRFGEVVRCTDETCRDPLAAGLTRIVGLDHLDSGELQIHRWGEVSEGTSFTRVFRKGQVLFGKRRAYQRKVAVADFEGICSGDLLVFEPKGQELIPELLPFIVQSDAFFCNAVGTSAGSLSPRTKWKELAEFEFILPNKSDQVRIASILSEVQLLLLSWRNVEDSLNLAGEAIASSVLQSGVPTRLGALLDSCEYGLSIPPMQEGAHPILRMMNLENGYVSLNEMRYVDLDAKTFESYRVKPKDIIFNRTNSIDLVGKLGYNEHDDGCVFASYLLRLRVNEEATDAEVLAFLLNSPGMQRRINALATRGASQANINAKNLRNLIFSAPDMKSLPALREKIHAIRLARESLWSQLEQATRLKQELTAHFFGDSNGL